MSVAASPRSLHSNETTSSSSWSNPRSSLLDGDADGVQGGGVGSVGRPSSNESGFTNPSSFGSIWALLQNQSPDHQVHRSVTEQQGVGRPGNSAYEAGTRLAHMAWLEMDAEVDEVRSSASPSSLEWDHSPVTPSSQAQWDFSSCPTYTCARCGTTLALQDELISKAFSGRDGKAFLFFSVLNIKVGPKEDRQLLTGLHTVADLSCQTCQRSVGWCYLRAFEASQRYKEGKFILERATLHKTNNWELEV